MKNNTLLNRNRIPKMKNSPLFSFPIIPINIFTMNMIKQSTETQKRTIEPFLAVMVFFNIQSPHYLYQNQYYPNLSMFDYS